MWIVIFEREWTVLLKANLLVCDGVYSYTVDTYRGFVRSYSLYNQGNPQISLTISVRTYQNTRRQITVDEGCENY